MAAILTLQGVQDLLEVHEDNVSITPKGVLGFLNKGLKGTKYIPYSSITAVQYREAGTFVNGFIQFTIPGGNESRGGVFAATKDENSFMFTKKCNDEALKIKNYIDAKLQKLRTPPQNNSSNLTEELQKLAAMKEQGILSEYEFTSAKNKLLGL